MEETFRSTQVCEFRFDGHTIRARFVPGAVVTVTHAREHIGVMQELTGRKPVRVLVDLRDIRSQDRGARATYAGPESRTFTLACALLVASPESRVIGSFFLGFNRPLYPTRLFTSLEEAEQWLSGF